MSEKKEWDFTMKGLITRSGYFKYPEGMRIKNWDNLKAQVEQINHLPVYGSRDNDSHVEAEDRLIGFAHDFYFIEPKEIDNDGHVGGTVELFEDIRVLSDLAEPMRLPVSLSFDDEGKGVKQEITGLHHVAVSLNANEKDRCSTAGGMPCDISPVYHGHNEVAIKTDFDKTPYQKLNKKTKKECIMEEQEEIEATEDMGDTTNERGASVDACVKSGKRKDECLIAETHERDGKMGDFDREILDEVLLENDALRKQIDDFQKEFKIVSDFKEKLQTEENNRIEAAKAELKNDLIGKGICEDFINNHDDYEFLKEFAKGLPKPESKTIVKTDLASLGAKLDDIKKKYDWMVI